jgi:hypothetical protein
MSGMMGTQDEVPKTDPNAKLKAEAISLASALHTVLSETTEGEIARIALAGLTSTETGRDYLVANPLQY